MNWPKKNQARRQSPESEQSDVSLKLPKRTGDYDKDIKPSPKLPKSRSGMKVKKSHSTTSVPTMNPGMNTEDTDTDSSEVFVPCSGTVASKKFSVAI